MKKNKKTKPKTPAKKNKGPRLLNSLRDDASVFLSSEEGKIVKKDIITAAVAMGLIASAAGKAHAQSHTDSNTPHTDNAAYHTDHAAVHSDVAATHTNSLHSDAISQVLHNDGATSGHSSGNVSIPAVNTNPVVHSDYANPHQDVYYQHADTAASHSDASHSNHSNHGDHGSGGWC
jgi:hypothetical protein